MALEKDLKEAILAMPQSEKDKILLRLIAKNDTLVKQLTFQLLEFGETLETRKKKIVKYIDRIYEHEPDSAGWLMMDMRSANAEITDFFKTTKDKYGEIELTIYLIAECYRKHGHLLAKSMRQRGYTLAEYVSKRTDAILKKLVKLHPDIQFDFHKDMNYILDRIHSSLAEINAKELNLPRVFEIKDI